jgi:hypothetical protein
MIYLMRFILWFIVIVFISWIIHRVVGKVVSNKKVKPFIGIITFLVIMLAPITIAKIAQVYYCWKYQPFYKIIKPLGEDFEGIYGSVSSDYLDKYPNIVKYIDDTLIIKDRNGYTFRAKEEWLGDKVKDINKSLIHKDDFDNEFVYVRDFIDKKGSQYCIKPNRKIMWKAMWKFYNSYFKQNKCIARKIIPESEVSRYKLHGKALEDKRIFIIPGVAYVDYHKSPVFIDRITGKPYAWSAGVFVHWDLYGVLGREGSKPWLGCKQLGFSIKDKMLNSLKGEKNGD